MLLHWGTMTSRFNVNRVKDRHKSFHGSPLLTPPVSSVVWAEPRKDEILQVKFGDGTDGYLPFVWLRDNCQCPQCFSEQAQGRKLLPDDLSLEAHPKTVKVMSALPCGARVALLSV